MQAERPSDLLPPRWYMVNNYGAATLCVDEADANLNAREADEHYPRHAPHVAVQLAPVRALDAAPSEPSAEHWRAALYEAREFQEWVTTQQAEWIEQRARELAKEGK